MTHQVNIVSLKGENTVVVVEKDPDSCPICHNNIQPKFVSAVEISDDYFDSIFHCPNESCRRAFIGLYGRDRHTGRFELEKTSPKTAKSEIFPDCIKTLSPTFTDIYNQSIAAEAHELDQISGVGLRKALEFLIKDYLCHQNADDLEKIEGIKKATLAQCINNYIDYEPLKRAATLATWLGNDETHYTRKFEDKDINHLKKLIQISVGWINSVIVGEELWNEMNAPQEPTTENSN